ncbi:MAG: hypothetical protein BWY52_02509 [Chloroflexi bacterium ADurb.Bin325]|nr:MAG: hypothetical protein BWY52_02509 [Chloroflexi bacterium ADurb.Bin325]
MERPTEQRRLDIDHRVAGQHPVVHRLPDALADRGDELLGDRAAHDLIHELEALAALLRLQLQDDVGILAAAARLPDEALLDLRLAGDGLAIRHLRPADVGLHAEPAQHPVDQHLQVQLAHPAQHGLAGLLVHAHPEGGILLGQPLQRVGELVLVGLGLRLHRDGDHRLRKFDGLQHDRPGRVAERLAGESLLDAQDGADIARANLGDVLALLGVDLHQPADALLAVAAAVLHRHAGLQCPRIDAHIGHPAHVRVGLDLEHQRGQRRSRIGRPLLLRAAGGVRADDRGDVERRRQIGDDRIEQQLDALGAQRCAAQHRHQLARDRGPAQGRDQLRLGDRLALEILERQRVVRLGDLLDQFSAQLRDAVEQFRRRRDLLRVSAQHIGERPGPLGDQIHHADEAILHADGQLDRQRVGAEPVADHADGAPEVCADPIHLVDEADARDAVAVGLPPDGLRLGLDAGHRIEDHHAAIEHAQAALHLRGEIDVARRVDDVDLVAVPLAGDGRGLDRDAALALLHHPVGDGRALIDVAHAVGLAGVVEDALGGGGLAGVDMRDDADVPQSLEARFFDCRMGLCSHSEHCAPERCLGGPASRRTPG